jgi:cytochrome c556
MKFAKICLAAGLLAGATAVIAVAADEPQVVRQELMKKNGAAIGALVAIAKGEKPYDAETVKTSLSSLSEDAKAFPEYFPEGTETGFKTEASPAIWANMDDFKALSMKLSTDADTLLANLPADQAAVGAAVKTLGGDCGACHQKYRLKN